MQNLAVDFVEDNQPVLVADFAGVGRVVRVGMAQMASLSDDKQKVIAVDMAFKIFAGRKGQIPDANAVILEQQAGSVIGGRRCHKVKSSFIRKGSADKWQDVYRRAGI